jgi:hypothetical protein
MRKFSIALIVSLGLIVTSQAATAQVGFGGGPPGPKKEEGPHVPSEPPKRKPREIPVNNDQMTVCNSIAASKAMNYLADVIQSPDPDLATLSPMDFGLANAVYERYYNECIERARQDNSNPGGSFSGFGSFNSW